MYVVRIVGPSGAERYLKNGQRVSYEEARWYNHPSQARNARDGFMARHTGFTADIFDPRDPERQVEHWRYLIKRGARK